MLRTNPSLNGARFANCTAPPRLGMTHASSAVYVSSAVKERKHGCCVWQPTLYVSLHWGLRRPARKEWVAVGRPTPQMARVWRASGTLRK
jgi:hypothetical protein